jgi:hypothetical protein
MRVCYLHCYVAGLCCYLVIHTETLLRPLQLFYFHLWPVYWCSFVQDPKRTKNLSRHNSLDLYSWGARFESRPEHRISWQAFCFPQPLQENSGTVPKLGHDGFIFNSSFNNDDAARDYIASMMKRLTTLLDLFEIQRSENPINPGRIF